MRIQVKRGAPAQLRAPVVCVPLFEGERIDKGPVAELDRAAARLISAVLRSGDFKGRLWSEVTLYNPRPAGPRRILLLGVGAEKDLDLERVRQAAARAVQRAGQLGTTSLAILFPTHTKIPADTVAQALAEGCHLGNYSYDRYKSSGRRTSVESVQLVATERLERSAAQQGVEAGSILAEATCGARDMVNAPANELTPSVMAERALAAAKKYGFKGKALELKDIERLGMAGLKAVSQGSDQPPRFIILEYDGGGRNAPRFVFVGKGITFDAGGICIKPAPKMDEMKGDMGGGAAVIHAVEAAARLELPVHLVGLVPTTENLLGASAYRPGDILKFANGKTVMIDNTDAEGRLVLADALVYAQQYKPAAVVDLATLTGAVLIALGQLATGVLGNQRQLIDDLKAAGERSFERLWELPLWEEYGELIRTPIADIKNTGGKNAGTITAAAFLKHFVGETPWAHLDIAGTSYLDKADGYRPQGGTGVGVRLLIEFLRGRLASET